MIYWHLLRNYGGEKILKWHNTTARRKKKPSIINSMFNKAILKNKNEIKTFSDK